MPKRKGGEAVVDLLEQGLVTLGSNERFVIQRVPFGLLELDNISNGGLPRNRVTLLTGEFSSGKTFLVQILLKAAIEQNLQVAYIDTERTYDPIWWQQVGIPIDKLLVTQPSSGEEAVNVASQLAVSGVDVVAIDSLAGMVPQEFLEEGAEKKFIGSQARLVNRLFQKVLAPGHKAAFLCTNQLRSSIGPGPFDTMPGGWGQLFFAHLVLRVYREGWIEEGGERVGFNMKVVCRKSKVGSPWGECILPFYFRGEIDRLALLMERALEMGLISQAGPWYSILGGEKVMGRNTVLSRLKEDKELRERLETAL